MAQSLRTNTLFEQIIREEYEIAKLHNRLNTSTNIITEETDTLASLAKSTDATSDRKVPKVDSSSKDTYSTLSVVPTVPKFKSVTSKLLTSTSVSDPNYKMKNPWKNKKAMEAIKAMGGKPYQFTGSLDKFELILLQGSEATDRLDLKEDGTVWSGQYAGTLNWALIPGGKLQISVNKVVGQVNLGIIYPSGGKAYFAPDAKLIAAINKQTNPASNPTAADKKQQAERADTIQYIADWLGLVPVYGDAIDLINGLVYLGRGKYFDALWSFVGIIPVIGSFFNLAFKTGKMVAKLVKSLRKIKGIKSIDDISEILRSGNSAKIAEMWRAWIDNQLFKPEQAKMFMNFFNTLKNKIQKPSAKVLLLKLAKLFGKNAQDVSKGIDETVSFCTNQSDAIAKALKHGDEAVDTYDTMTDIALAVEKGLIKPENAMAKMATKGVLKTGWKGADFSKGGWGYKKILKELFFKRIGNANKLNPAVLQGVTNTMFRMFIKKWGKETDDLAQLLSTTPGVKTITDMICRLLVKDANFMADYTRYVAQRLGQASPNVATVTRYLNENLFLRNGKLKSVPEITHVLNYIGTQSENALAIVTRVIVKYAAKNMNPIYTSFAADAGNQVLAYFTRAKTGMGKQIKAELLQNMFSARKKIDIIMSEIEDISEYIYTIFNPESYYKPGTIQSLPVGNTKNPKTGEYDQNSAVMTIARKYATVLKTWWGSMEDDEQNGILFETLMQPKFEEIRNAATKDFLNTESGKYLKQQLEDEIQPGKVIMKQFTGADIGMDKSLAKTKGYDPSKINTKDKDIYPIGY